MDLMNMIASLGFPIVACSAMGMYVRDLTNKHKEEISMLVKEHREEIKEITTAIDNNTVAVQELCIMLREEK